MIELANTIERLATLLKTKIPVLNDPIHMTIERDLWRIAELAMSVQAKLR